MAHARKELRRAQDLLVLEIRCGAYNRQRNWNENEGIRATENDDARPHFEKDDEEVRLLLKAGDGDSDGCSDDSV